MSILSPINPDRFQIELVSYGSGAAGNMFTFPVFTANATAIVNISCRFATTIAAANRMVYLQLLRDAVWSYFAPALRVQTANKGPWYSFAPGNPATPSDDSLMFACTVPPDLLFIKDDTLSIRVVNMDAGDTIQDVTAYWKIFPTG